MVHGGRIDDRDDHWGALEAAIELQPHLVPVVAGHGAGLDALDGSPVFDLRPWMTEFGPNGATRQPGWATQVMSDYYVE